MNNDKKITCEQTSDGLIERKQPWIVVSSSLTKYIEFFDNKMFT